MIDNLYFLSKIPSVKRVTDYIQVLTNDYKYKDIYGVEQIIKRGFLTDGASRPKWLEFYVQKDSLNNGAFLIHDHMYWHQTIDEKAFTRENADRLLLINLLRNPNNRIHWCLMVYFTLRLTGGKAWQDNIALKASYGTRNRYMQNDDIVELEKAINNDE